jgi:hypothetical protein
MGSPKESLEQKIVFTEKYDEIRRLDGNALIPVVLGVYFKLCSNLTLNLRLIRGDLLSFEEI